MDDRAELESVKVSKMIITDTDDQAESLVSSSTTTYGEKIVGDSFVYDHLIHEMNSISDVKLRLRKATQDALGDKTIMLSAPD